MHTFDFMTLSFARSSGSIYTLCSGLAKSRCGGVLVVDIHHVYHQHFLHFIPHVFLSMLKCFILMSSTSFDDFVREGAHRRNLRAIGLSGRPIDHFCSLQPPTEAFRAQTLPACRETHV